MNKVKTRLKQVIRAASLIVCLFSNEAYSQNKSLPVIDMHLHALNANDQGPAPISVGAPFRDLGLHDPKNDYRKAFMNALKTNTWSDKFFTSPSTDDSLREITIAALKKHNVYGITSGEAETLDRWHQAAPSRIIKSLDWNFAIGKKLKLDVDSLRKLFKKGEYRVFGEITLQYEGFTASDSAFEPYLALAEELDIPVGIHIGCGPPGAPYIGSTGYRARLHSPLGLEEALLRHPKLRVYVMHAGWPMLDDMMAMLYTYPHLYVDIAVICYMIPQKEFYFYLKRLVEAGFGKRIMFGSDNMVWPQAIEAGINAIKNAPFLSELQKRDILFNNAVRFLRLSEEEVKKMH